MGKVLLVAMDKQKMIACSLFLALMDRLSPTALISVHFDHITTQHISPGNWLQKTLSYRISPNSATCSCNMAGNTNLIRTLCCGRRVNKQKVEHFTTACVHLLKDRALWKGDLLHFCSYVTCN